MYSRKRAKLPDNITLDWILSKVTEYDIYAKYIGQFKVGMIYNLSLIHISEPTRRS